jgi:hypothetical protein
VTDYERLLRAPGDARVEFIVIGGLAATAHGSARLTQDLDVVYSRSPENIRRLAEALRPLNPYLRGAPAGLPFKFEPKTITRGLNFTLQTSHGPVNLLGEVTGGGGYTDLLTHTVDIELFGVRCKCIDLPTLIRVKRAAGRPRDLDALAELEALLEESQRRADS